MVVGEELGSNIGNPRPSGFKPMIQIYFYLDEKKPESFDSGFLMVVGEEGFEPPTLWSQTRCATKLRYSPTNSFLGTRLEGSTLWSAIPNIRDALPNCAIHRQ